MSPEEFRVALGELQAGDRRGARRGEHIAGLIGQVEARFEAAQTHWRSPRPRPPR